MQEGNILVEGIKMNYAKVGSGKHAVLLGPSAFGTAELHFADQAKNINNTKTDSVRVESAWFAKSRPANRTFPQNFQRTQCILDLSPNGNIELSTMCLDRMVYRRVHQHRPSSETPSLCSRINTDS